LGNIKWTEKEKTESNLMNTITRHFSDEVIKHVHLVAGARLQNPILVVDRTASRAPPTTFILLVHFHYMMPAPKTYLPKYRL
jgi:hypothetical protein